MPTKKGLLFVLCLFSGVFSVCAEDVRGIIISNPYMPAVPPVSRTAAVYLAIENTSNRMVTLTGVSTSIAKHSMIHQSVEVDGLMTMKHQSEIEIKPGQIIEFKPGGRHIMLMGLNTSPMLDKFKLNLLFKSKAKEIVEVIVIKRS